MKIFATLFFVFLAAAVTAQPRDTRYFELRVYYAASGKLDALIDRFASNTTRIFEKHGMQNIGYWVPTNNTSNALYYILAFPSKQARDESWKKFGNDPEWKKVATESEKNGKLVDSVKSVFMTATDILPYTVDKAPAGNDRFFELRTYYCYPGRFPNIVKRFHDHTTKLFEKHGIENIAYFGSDANNGKEPFLVYMIANKNEAEHKKEWDEFRTDPDWIKVKDDSEKDGKIVEKIESVFLKPLPFSAIR
jgi:hypothetical protein